VSVAVVGAGISGVACARALAAAGVDVVVHERSRAVGGRMASPRLHERRVDTGAAYFTVAPDAGFAAVAADWSHRGLAHEWTTTMGVHSPGGATTKDGPARWSAPGGLRSLVADLADGLDVRLGSAVSAVGPGLLVDGTTHDAVVLAMPDPQALRLLDPTHAAARAQLTGRDWKPVIAVAVGARTRTWGELTATFVNDHPVLALVVDDGARRGDGAPVLLAHTTNALAAQHLEDPDAVVPAVLTALADVLPGELTVEWTHAHRWTFAQPAGSREDTHWLTDGLGLCGDGWGAAKVEAAWTSGTALGRAIAARR
jgi:renalase